MNKYFKYSTLSLHNKLLRVLWGIVWLFLYRPSPRLFHAWRCALLQIFGAKIGKHVHPYPSAKIWAPWNLTIGDYSSLGNYVDCYSVDKIIIGNNVTISQYSFICTASHDYRYLNMPLITSPIFKYSVYVIPTGVSIHININFPFETYQVSFLSK